MENTISFLSSSSSFSSSSLQEEKVHDPVPPPSPPLPPQKKHGGWKAVRYILGNESFEKLASMGLISNLTVYLQSKYNMDGIHVVNVYNGWSGSTNLTPLVGAFISDAYLGRFYTLLFGSISSFLGAGIITLTAGVRSLRPLNCIKDANCEPAHGWQLALLYSGLGLLSIGAGGIRPCNIAFGADQFDTSTEKGRSQLESFFNWWYFLFTVALAIALTVVVYIQTNVSWTIGFGIPTACLFVSIAIFLIGKHTYIMAKPEGSVFVDFSKVIVAAYRKRKVTMEPGSEASLYDPPVSEQQKNLPHTDRFLFFDKAAKIVHPSELDDQGKPKYPWRLCSMQQVEQMKLLLGVVPIWFTGIGCFITMDQMNTFGLMQAIQSNNNIGNFKIPPGWMGLVSMICLSIWILIYEQVYMPRGKNMSKSKDKRLTMRQRINTGIVMAILCMLVAATVEKKRRTSALEHGSFTSPLSILALLPQFALSGLNEAFAAVAIMEFYTTHLPDGMRTIAGAIFFLSFSASSYLNTALVNIVHHLTGKNGRSPWLGGRDLNKVNVDKFYYLIAGLAALNLLYFNLFSCHYLRENESDKKFGSSQEKNGMEMNGVDND